MSEADWNRDFTFRDLANASEWASRVGRLFPNKGIDIHSVWFADRHGRLLFRIKNPDSGDLLCAAAQGKRWIEECFKKLQPDIRSVAEKLKPMGGECQAGMRQYLVPVMVQDRLSSVAGVCYSVASPKAEAQAFAHFKKSLVHLSAGFDGDVIRVDTFNPTLRLIQSLVAALEPRRDAAAAGFKTNQGLDMVWDVSKLVTSSQDFAVVLKAVARIVTRRLGVDMCSIYIYDKKQKLLKLKAVHGVAKRDIARTEIKLGEGISGIGAARREITAVRDVAEHPDYREVLKEQDHRRFPSLLSVPMVVKNELIGVMNVRTQEVHDFTEMEKNLLAAIAGQVAVGLKNAELRTQLAELAFDFPSDSLLKYDGESMKLTTLEAISKLISTSLDFDKTLENVVSVVSNALGIDVCSIYLLDRKSGMFVLRATKGLDARAIGKVKVALGDGITGWTAEQKKPILLQNASAHPKYKHFALTGEESYNSMLSVPLLDKGTALGVINVQDTTNREFTQDELKMLSTIGSQVAGIIRNAKLYSDITKKLNETTALLEVGKVVTSTIDLDELLNLVAKLCAQTMDARGSIIRLMNEQTGRIEVQAAYGFGQDALKSASVSVGEGIAGWVVANRRPTLVHNVPDDTRFAQSLKVFVKNMVAVPLVAKNNCIGLIAVYDKLPEGDVPRQFVDDDMRLLSIMADEAAMAIANARLFDTVERAERKLRDTQEQLIRSEKLAALGDMLAGVAHEVRNPLVSIGGFARLMASEVPEDSSHKKYLNLMIREVSRLETMVKDILFFARSHKKKVGEVNLAEVIDRTLLMVDERLQEHGIKVETDICAETPTVTADSDALIQSILNVVQNSIEAMSDGGLLRIGLAPVEPEKVRISIEDTGSGIPEEQLENILNPFNTTKTSGAGIGLSITNKIIEDHGGRLEFSSRVGEGTVCAITLPAARK